MLFASMCLALTIVSAHAENLLKNPSYEEVGASDDTAANWFRWGDWINRETAWTPVHGGQCMIGYHHWQITNDQNSGIWQDVTSVKAGQRFKFTVFIAADKPDGRAMPADKLELRLEAIRNGKELIVASKTALMAEIQQIPGWHELSVTGTTPEDNIRVLVVVSPAPNAPRGGAIKIDDAKLELVH